MTENRKATNLMLDIFAYFEFLEFSGGTLGDLIIAEQLSSRLQRGS